MAISSTESRPSDHVVWQWRSPRTSSCSTSRGGSPAKGASRSSGGHQGMPSSVYTPSSSAASGSGSSAATYAGAPVLRTAPCRSRRLRKGERHRHALDGHPERGAFGPFDDRHDLREPVERVEDLRGSCGRDDDREVERESAQRRGSPAISPPSASAISPTRSRAACSVSPRRGRLRLRVQALEDPALGRGPDARHALQRALAGDPAEVLRGLGAERGGDVQHPLRRDAEQAAEPDQLRSNPAAELVQLGDRAGLCELAQSRGDPRADSPQLAHATLADERHDRRSASRGSSLPLAGTRVRRTGSTRQGRAARRTPRARRRPWRCRGRRAPSASVTTRPPPS